MKSRRVQGRKEVKGRKNDHRYSGLVEPEKGSQDRRSARIMFMPEEIGFDINPHAN
jgi:hypothetical protein